MYVYIYMCVCLRLWLCNVWLEWIVNGYVVVCVWDLLTATFDSPSSTLPRWFDHYVH